MLDFDNQRDLPAVLLIDDDLVSREVMATILTLDGYSVHTAAGGDASLELLAGGECAPGVILVDVQMPGLSGNELIQALRAHSQAKIFAVSASRPPDEVAAAVDGVLLKPLGPDALTKLLHQERADEEASSASSREAGDPSQVTKRNGSGNKSAPGALSCIDPADPVISPETLAQLRDMMPDSAVRQIFSAIVADLATRVKALEIAIAKDDAKEVRRIGHAIKGGCGMAGALQIARLGAFLESGALESNGNHLDNSTVVLNDLRTAALNLKSMLDAEFPA